MSEQKIILPSKPKAVQEEGNKGIFEIDGLVPGYGYTLGNSLRRIILSSLPGAAITAVKIDGVSHEFSTIEGVKEDVITILLNLKNVRFQLTGDEPAKVSFSVKGPKIVTAADINAKGAVSISNPEQYICEITGKAGLNVELTIERGLGFVPRDAHHKQKADIGTIFLDAIFSPIRRVSYDVEEMRVGDKTNFNRLRLTIETDGTLSPREALETSVGIMIEQLAAMISVDSGKIIADVQTTLSTKAPIIEEASASEEDAASPVSDEESVDVTDVLKNRIDGIGLSTRTLNALSAANIRTVGGIARKRVDDLLEIDGIGDKGITEIKEALAQFNLSLKD
ncbi:MAG TPA: DNA-directed RNA polymerase subunit alpha [Candidatus Paceibacterota bacterium]|jgi:DNA-directed RNA polymerase subunit alpha|nr:DNA-directed RNA polymerase subunit alpha [Candidatus Paceibacterota bacterium]